MSNLTSPAAAQSSLSHCSTLRSSMRAHSTGHTSSTGRSHSTMPPEWMPRWRGECWSSPARASTGGGMSWSAVPGGGAERTPAVDLLGPGVQLALGEPEGLAHVPHRRLGPVGDDVGHLGRVLAAVVLVDVLDGLLPAVALDVHVDVGRPVALGGEEALEEQAEGDGVGVGDPEGVTHRRVGRRPPPLAVDVVAPAELHDVPDDEEVAGEAQLVDHVQLVVDLGVGPGVGRAGRGARSAGAAPRPR